MCYSDVLDIQNTDKVLRAVMTPTNELMDEYSLESSQKNDDVNEISAIIIQTNYRNMIYLKKERAARRIQRVVIHNIDKKMKRMLSILESRNRKK